MSAGQSNNIQIKKGKLVIGKPPRPGIRKRSREKSPQDQADPDIINIETKPYRKGMGILKKPGSYLEPKVEEIKAEPKQTKKPKVPSTKVVKKKKKKPVQIAKVRF